MSPDFYLAVQRAVQRNDIALSAQVRISHGEVLRIVTQDLMSKYKSNCERGDSFWADAFRTVLRYYMSEDEIDSALAGVDVWSEEEE